MVVGLPFRCSGRADRAVTGAESHAAIGASRFAGCDAECAGAAGLLLPDDRSRLFCQPRKGGRNPFAAAEFQCPVVFALSDATERHLDAGYFRTEPASG